MTTNRTLASLAASCLLAALAGCAGVPPPGAPQDTTRFTVGNTERFVTLDPAADAAVTCTGLQERTLPDGRLEVVANVKNRGSQPVKVAIACVFADDQGMPVAGEAAWSVLGIAGDATEVVRFSAPGPAAKRYSIRVRDAR